MDGFRIDRENTQKSAMKQDVLKVRRKSKYMFPMTQKASKCNGIRI